MKKSGEFSKEVIRILAKRAGERCSLCTRITAKPHESNSENYINLGEAAHIKGNRNAPNNRYDGNITPEEKSSINNAIWLCQGCHKIIDSDSLKYSVEYLESQKRNHEHKILVGYYDSQWQEIEILNVRIAHLEEKISLTNEISTLHDEANLKLRIEIEQLTNERADLVDKITRLTELVLSLNLDNPTANTKKIIDAFRNKDRETLNSLLDEEKLLKEERELAQKRVIKGVLFEIDKDYNQAELNYEKAFDISQSHKYLEIYISLLERKFKFEDAINACTKALKIFNDEMEQAQTLGFMAQLSSKLNRNKDSINYLQMAIDLSKEKESTDARIFRANLYSAMGMAQKNIGDFNTALKSYQTSLNILWKTDAGNENTKYFAALGMLWNGMGLLYLENGDVEVAIHHFSCSIEIFKDPLYYDRSGLLVVYLNMSDVFLKPSHFNLEKAQEYLENCFKLLKDEYEKYPLQYLKYYLGCLTKQGNNFIIEQKYEEAKTKFELAIQMIHSHTKINNINLDDELSHIYPNYAVLLQVLNQKEEALSYLDLTINLLERAYEDSEYEINFSLSKLYFQKFELTKDKAFLLKSKEFSAKVPLNLNTLKWKIIVDKTSLD